MDDAFNNLMGGIEGQRERMTAYRETVATLQQELSTKLQQVNRELAAIDAYLGAPAMPAPPPAPQVRRSLNGSKRGSKREEIRAVLLNNPGLTRGELLDKLGLKRDKSGLSAAETKAIKAAEMSVSNALTGMKAAAVLRNEGGKYYVAAAG